MNTTAGQDLRSERAAAYLTVKQIARAMGVHRNTVAAMERDPEVKAEKAIAYRDAIARLSKAAA